MNTPEKEIIPDCNYDVVMSIKNDKYYFYIKELQILGRGDDLNLAYKDLTDKKEKLIREFQEGENLNELPNPSKKSASISGGNFQPIRIFLMKLFIIIFLAVLVLPFVATLTQGALIKITSPAIQAIKDKIRLKNLGNYLLIQLDDAVEHDISPETEKRIIENIRVLGRRLQPFVIEIRALLNPDDKELKSQPGESIVTATETLN